MIQFTERRKNHKSQSQKDHIVKDGCSIVPASDPGQQPNQNYIKWSMHTKLGLRDGRSLLKMSVIAPIETNRIERGNLMPVLILVVGADGDEMGEREVL